MSGGVGQIGVSGSGGSRDVDLTIDVTGVLPIANGGTAGATAAAARTALSAAASGVNTDITSVYLNNTGLKIKDTNASHGLIIAPNSNITADRTLNLITGDADATINAAPAAFFAYLPSAVSNVTGTGTVFQLGSGTALTEVFDRGGDFDPATGTFTARHTGYHRFEACVHMIGCTISTFAQLQVVASNRDVYLALPARPAGSSTWSVNGSTLIDMEAGDTAVFKVIAGGEAGNTVDVYGSNSPYTTWVSGHYVCPY